MTANTSTRKTSSPTLRLLLTENLTNTVRREIMSRESRPLKRLFNRDLRAEFNKCKTTLESFDTDSLLAVNNAYLMNDDYSVVPSLTTYGFNEQLTRNHAQFFNILKNHGFSSRECFVALEALGCSSLSLISMRFSPLEIPRARANLTVISHFLRIEAEEAEASNRSLPVTGETVRGFPASLSRLLREQPGLASRVIEFAEHRELALKDIDAGVFLEWNATSSKTLSNGVL